MDRRVLVLKPESLVVLQVEKEDCYVERSFTIRDAGIPESFRDYITANRQFIYKLLIDLQSEEGYFEVFPKVGTRDRKLLLERFRLKHFHAALMSDVCAPRRRNGTGALVCGVNSDPLLLELLNLIKQSGVLLNSIHSPLLLTDKICAELNTRKNAQLLVIPSERCRCTIIACIDSAAVFVRQVRVDVTDSVALGAGVNETLRYLKRQEVGGWEAPVVTLLGMFGDSDRDSLFSTELVDPDLATRTDVALSAGVVEHNVIQPIDKVFARATLNAGVGYADRSLRRSHRQRRFRSVAASLSASAIVGLVSTVAIANKLDEKYETIAADYLLAADATNAIDLMDEQYEYSVEAVRQALVTAKLNEIQSLQSPITFYSELASLVDNEPAISVDSVSWDRQDHLDEKSLNAIVENTENIDKLSMAQVFSATISGSVVGNAGSALDHFETFVSNLRETSTRPSVVVVEAPFGLGADTKTTTADLSAQKAMFSIELINGGELQ